MEKEEFLELEKKLIDATREFSKEKGFSLKITDHSQGFSEIALTNSTHRDFVRFSYSPKDFQEEESISIKGLQAFWEHQRDYKNYIVDNVPEIKKNIKMWWYSSR